MKLDFIKINSITGRSHFVKPDSIIGYTDDEENRQNIHVNGYLIIVDKQELKRVLKALEKINEN